MKNSPVRILIADDEKNFREVLMTTLSDEGFDVTGADSSLKAKDLLEKEEYDVLLLDLNMPEVGGMEVLKKIKTFEIPTEVVILTGVGIVSTAVEAMKLGAYDYLTKPFKIEELKAVIEKAYEKKKLRSENLLLKTQIKKTIQAKKHHNKNTLMLDILETVKRLRARILRCLFTARAVLAKS